MDSYRDKVEAAISENWPTISTIGITKVADAVFDTLAITKAEQDMTGGYFMLHAGVKGNPGTRHEGFVEDLIAGEGDFSSEVLTSAKASPPRIQEAIKDFDTWIAGERLGALLSGAKYTSAEFKAHTVCVFVEETKGWYLTMKTPICKYGQSYGKNINRDRAKTKFVNSYYSMYLLDYERWHCLDEMDEK